MKNFDDFKERVRREIPIHSYITRFVPLKKSGKNYLGICPFHSEKSPSFSVNSEGGYYHCFGCKASGDLIRFVMDYQKVDFVRSLELISEFSGIPFETSVNANEKERKKAYYLLNEKVLQSWTKNLFTKEGTEALDYLKQRGLSEDEIKLFQIGYALDGFGNLWGNVIRTDEEKQIALELGILKRSEKDPNHSYDFFRNRIVFPIKDISGRVIGYSCRALGETKEAKYINSPNSLIYDKGKALFNLFLAQDAIRKTRSVVLVEGVMDAVGLATRGIPQSLAPLGTAFTESQAKILKNLVDVVYLMMDGDTAGRKGAFRATEILHKEGVSAKVVLLPPGKDPFDTSREKNLAELRQTLDSALTSFEFLLSEILEGSHRNSDLEIKDKSLNKLFGFVRSLDKEVEKESLLKEGAERLGLSFSSVWSDFQKGKAVDKNKMATPKTDTKDRVLVSNKTKLPKKYFDCERKILTQMVMNQELFAFADEIQEMDFLDENSAVLWEFLYTRFLQNGVISPAEILSEDILPASVKEGFAPYFWEGEKSHSPQTDSSFKELMLQHRIVIYDYQMDQVMLDSQRRDISLEDRKEALSKMALLKNEKQKILEHLRELTFSANERN